MCIRAEHGTTAQRPAGSLGFRAVAGCYSYTKRMMTREIGDPVCPLWLLGDSNPTEWEDLLESRLDPRHPARHNIVTPIFDGVQDHLYRAGQRRIETRKLYIRNAIADARSKPDAAEEVWDAELCEQVAELGKLLKAKGAAYRFHVRSVQL
jgi:hypothetical protein